MFVSFDLFNKIQVQHEKQNKKNDKKKVQIIHVLVEAEEKRRIGGRDGEVKGVTFWIPQRGNKKQQVRKKKN